MKQLSNINCLDIYIYIYIYIYCIMSFLIKFKNIVALTTQMDD